MRVLYTRGPGLAANQAALVMKVTDAKRRLHSVRDCPNSNLSAARDASMYTFWLCDIVSSPTIVRKHIGPN